MTEASIVEYPEPGELEELAVWLDGFARQCCAGPGDRERLVVAAATLRGAAVSIRHLDSLTDEQRRLIELKS